jgi:6-phosphogluconolactonase
MIEVFPTPDALADAVARHVVECAQAAISATGRFTVALSGGSTPKAAYSRLASADWGLANDQWRRVHVVWGDERCVPPDDPRSNYRMAKEALLDRVPIPPDQIHRIRGEDEPQKAAAEYERQLRLLLTCHPERSDKDCHPERSPRHPERSEGAGTSRLDEQPPSGPLAAFGVTGRLDLVLLGLGEDGHTASLFPGQPAVHETERWVLAVPAPTGHMWRVTLTPAILNSARNVTFIVAGAGKAARLQQVIERPFAADQLPAQAIRPIQGRLTWMVDQAAAGQLGPVRASP